MADRIRPVDHTPDLLPDRLESINARRVARGEEPIWPGAYEWGLVDRANELVRVLLVHGGSSQHHPIEYHNELDKIVAELLARHKYHGGSYPPDVLSWLNHDYTVMAERYRCRVREAWGIVHGQQSLLGAS